MKKATPRAVFEACEQLELLDNPWNRDDVRILVGGGSFSIIDPLIQAWRKMTPVREVAPSLPTDLLIQVATLIEQQVSGYIAEVDERDQVRENSLLEVSEALTENLQAMELELTDKLENAYSANHDLEAECARLEGELTEKTQVSLTLEIQLKAAEDSAVQLKQQLNEQRIHFDQSLKQQREDRSNAETRLSEKAQQDLDTLKAEHAQQLVSQLSEQKNQLLESAEMSENRLMRLLDQSREELKELGSSAQDYLQQRDQLSAANSLLIKEKQKTEGDHAQSLLQSESQYALLKTENENLKQQITDQAQGKSEMGELKDSILLLQKQMEGL